MLLIGPVSSLYDFLTFWVLLAVFRAPESLFHTGWFVESLATQTLVLFVIRTAGNPLRSRPSAALTVTTIAIVPSDSFCRSRHWPSRSVSSRCQRCTSSSSAWLRPPTSSSSRSPSACSSGGSSPRPERATAPRGVAPGDGPSCRPAALWMPRPTEARAPQSHEAPRQNRSGISWCWDPTSRGTGVA